MLSRTKLSERPEPDRSAEILGLYLVKLVRNNTDMVCYSFFVIVYAWNFSILTLVFPTAVFIYGLLANPGPGHGFWLAILIYTEANILVQYTYQIIANCRDLVPLDWQPFLDRYLGISKYDGSFVFSVLPLFLVYLSTLFQTSIKARDGEWMMVSAEAHFGANRRNLDSQAPTPTPTPSDPALFWPDFWRAFTTHLNHLGRKLNYHWHSLTKGSESPPYFLQVSMRVRSRPEEGIQPEKIETGMNALLATAYELAGHPRVVHYDGRPVRTRPSRVRVESINASPDYPDVELAVLEVIYAAPPPGTIPGPDFQCITPAAGVAAEVQLVKDARLVEKSGFPYPIMSVVAGGKREVDLYAYNFGVDLLAFVYVALTYQSAVKDRALLSEYIQQEDQFPKDFVFVLMTLFFLIVVDRVIYILLWGTGKVIYHLFCLILFTSYVVHLFWNLRLEISRNTFRIFYLLKSLSFVLTALQIKYGFPSRADTVGHFLMKKVNLLSRIGFMVYRAVPFLFELRSVLDWSCTSTALLLYDWLKLEDIYASLYLVQCDNKVSRGDHHLGQKQDPIYKFCNGICLFLVLVSIIWAPMLMYSTGNPTNWPNPVIDVEVAITVNTVQGSFPLYQAGGRRKIIDNHKPPEDLRLSLYTANECQLICCYSDADQVWQIPPPAQNSLRHFLDANTTLQVSWAFHRVRPVGKEVVYYEATYPPLETTGRDGDGGNSEITRAEVAERLHAVLNGSTEAAFFPSLYPLYWHIPGSGKARILEDSKEYVSGNLTLRREAGVLWWSFLRSPIPAYESCEELGPIAVTASEEVPGYGIIGETLTRFSIMSLYITFVLGVGRFLRLQWSDLRMRIPYENFPACDRLVAICEDIYAARAEGELELEEGLFWTLIKIYRSPHILLEYTKLEKQD